MAYEVTTPDLQVASAAFKEILANGGTMDVRRMNALTNAAKGLGDNVVKDVKVKLGEIDIRARNAKTIEAEKLNASVRRQIEKSIADAA